MLIIRFLASSGGGAFVWGELPLRVLPFVNRPPQAMPRLTGRPYGDQANARSNHLAADFGPSPEASARPDRPKPTTSAPTGSTVPWPDLAVPYLRLGTDSILSQ